MTIYLPNDLEASLRAVVMSGHFANEDDAVAEIVRDYFRQKQAASSDTSNRANTTGLGFIGALRDDADLLDQAVEHAMKIREERPWRLSPVE